MRMDMKRSKVGVVLVMLALSSAAGLGAVQDDSPQGFAAFEAYGLKTTTGGLGGTVVTVTDAAQFIQEINKNAPAIIQVNGVMALSSMHAVKSNKTIVGVDSTGVISGGGLEMSNASNIIIRNLLFENSSDDAINIQDDSHHIWIDHCDFRNAYDGLIDIKQGSDCITVSWNTFSDHDKTCLLGHDDNNAAQDSGRLRVTYHHNWFNATGSRHPRVRFSGLCHVMNNWYVDNSYGVASTMNAEVLVENNAFLRVGSPTRVGLLESGPGDLVQTGNSFEQCGNPPQEQGEVPVPPYPYALDAAADVPALVQADAGRSGFTFVPITAPAWQVYDGSVLPAQNLPAFKESNVTNPPDTTSRVIDDPDLPGNKLLMFSNPLTEASKFMWGLNWEMDAARGATIAFRVKPLDPALYDRVFEVEFRDGSLRERFFVLNDGEVELDRADTNSVLSDNPEGWHTYRITYQNGASAVYVDEAPTPLLTGLSTSSNSTNDLRFGDGSDGNTTGFLLDWLVFDTSGAFAPGEQVLPDSLKVDRLKPVIEWQVYDGSVLPNQNTPAFKESNALNPPDTTSRVIDDPDLPDNKLLLFSNPLTEASKFMWGINWQMDPAIGATIAFRVKPLDPELYDRVFEIEFRDALLRERFFVLNDGEVELDRADTTAVLPDNPTGWHTYRITYQNGASAVYVDESPTPLLTGISTSSNSTNDLRFGDGSDGNTHGFLLDWLVFDITGAHAPTDADLPEDLFVDSPGTFVIAAHSHHSPAIYDLAQNYPNPFNPVTLVPFALSRPGKVRLTVHNALGQHICTLVDGRLPEGKHAVRFDAAGLSSGQYCVRLEMDGVVQVRKMMLVR